MRVFQITIDGGDDLKETVARLLCPDPDHAPPCPVPWSFDSVGRPLVVSVCVDDVAVATALIERVRAITDLGTTLSEADPADHDALVEQFRAERC
ncbi:MAG: hypothetical protein M3422_07890 [Actinomycetota bacterium]|nr:hypothetical protein [Actinomycetota bacterium]